jgi:hypothetical protein
MLSHVKRKDCYQRYYSRGTANLDLVAIRLDTLKLGGAVAQVRLTQNL